MAPTTSRPKLTRFMDKFWRLQRPEVIITIAGGAEELQLPPQLQLALDRGLASAAPALT